MADPTPFDNSELYDQLAIGQLYSPGQLTLSGHERGHKWDVKEADGSSGASTTAKGEKLAQFTASFYLVRDDYAGRDDFQEWNAFVRYLGATLKKSPPEALDIYHPDLAALEITSVVVEGIGGLVHDGKGGATGTIKLLEYRPPKKAGGSPKGSKGGKPQKASIGTVDPNSQVEEYDPNKDVKDELAAAQAEANEKPTNPFQGVG